MSLQSLEFTENPAETHLWDNFVNDGTLDMKKTPAPHWVLGNFAKTGIEHVLLNLCETTQIGGPSWPPNAMAVVRSFHPWHSDRWCWIGRYIPWYLGETRTVGWLIYIRNDRILSERTMNEDGKLENEVTKQSWIHFSDDAMDLLVNFRSHRNYLWWQIVIWW